MKIGVISDTHLRESNSPSVQPLKEILKKHFHGVDMILHAGDVGDLKFLNWLSSIAPTYAVWGNMDSFEVKQALPDKRVIELKEFKVGLTHGWGPPWGLAERVRSKFDENINCLVFGHSHQPFNEFERGVLYFNPGTPTDRQFATVNTIGILTVEEGIKGEIIYL